ncbi:N-acetylneuraminate synthase family protein [Candidatus Woesearchaeota archaeon]|nr:N-acetylneuraminate synthase family protein [Candidatus Woesearchaeota archaeon]
MTDQTKPYLIGETAYNHEGDYTYLQQMVDELAAIGVHAVKFHLLLDIDSYIQKDHPLKKKLKEWIFSEKQWKEIINYANERGLEVIALCDDVKSIRFLKQEALQIAGIELHAACINDHYMLEEMAKTKVTTILGIGGTNIEEIDYAIRFLKERGKATQEFLMMHGFQSYPTDYRQINIAKAKKLEMLFGIKTGYADHTSYEDENNLLISVLGAANGMNILEKHYTPEEGKERIDYHAATGKEGFKKILLLMDSVLRAHGTGDIGMSPAEKKYGNVGPMKKAIVARKNIKKGEELSIDNLWFKRTIEESPIDQTEFSKLLGAKARRDIQEDKPITYEDVHFHFKESNLNSFTHKRSDK